MVSQEESRGEERKVVTRKNGGVDSKFNRFHIGLNGEVIPVRLL